MGRKLFIFLTGTILLSVAWIGATSSIESQQKAVKAENALVTLDLMQSRWQRLAGFKAVEGGKIKKPAEFVYTFSGPEMILVNSVRSEEIASDLYLDVKEAAVSADKKSPFYIFESPTGDQFLIRSSRIGEELEVTGIDLDFSLNFFGRGLENPEWFFLDAKKRVLAAGERAYVGKVKAAGKSYNSFKYTVSGKSYEFLTPKEQERSLLTAKFAGVFGIVFVMISLFIYTENKRPLDAELYVKNNVNPPAAVAVSSSVKPKYELENDDIPEDVRMVDLTNTKNPVKEDLDYTGFLIENPILGEAPEGGVEVKSSKSVDEVTKVETVTSDEWVKLAEELSASIDKFTQTAEKNNKSTDSSKADA